MSKCLLILVVIIRWDEDLVGILDVKSHRVNSIISRRDPSRDFRHEIMGFSRVPPCYYS